MTSAPPHSTAAAAARELRAAPWLYLSPLLLVATGAVLLATSAATWLALLVLLAGAILLVAGLAGALATASGYRGPQGWQRIRGTHPDQHHSPDA